MTTEIPGKLVKGVYQRVLHDDVTPQLRALLSDAGIDLGHPLKEAYARSVWYRGIELTAQALFPGVAADESQRKLGRHIIGALESRNLVKGPWLSMAKLMGPRRALLKAAQWGASASPVRLTVRERTSKALEVSIEEDQQTGFLAGLLEGLIEALGGKTATVTVESTAHGQAVLAASWR